MVRKHIEMDWTFTGMRKTTQMATASPGFIFEEPLVWSVLNPLGGLQCSDACVKYEAKLQHIMVMSGPCYPSII